ncbi:MAG: hypothetical protein ACXV9R_05345 [Methylobacter sp.]
MNYSISSHSRVSFIKHSMPLALLVGLLALSPCKQGQAQTGSEEGSTGSAGAMQPGNGSRKNTMDPPGTGTESSRSRGNTGSPGTTNGGSDVRQGKHKGMGNKGSNGSGTSGTGTGSSGSGTGSSGTSGSGSGSLGTGAPQ